MFNMWNNVSVMVSLFIKPVFYCHSDYNFAASLSAAIDHVVKKTNKLIVTPMN